MQRIPEPELMDQPLQARAYAQADFARSEAAFTRRVLQVWAGRAAASSGRPARVLDLGCGPGNISFRLADALPDAAVVGLDGAAAMLERACWRQSLEPQRWPLLHWHRGLLPLAPDALQALPAAWAPPYDLLVSNSLLHHLHDPAGLWSTVRQLAAPGALVVARDLRRPTEAAALRALVRRHAARAPAVLRRDYAHSLAAAFRPQEVRLQLDAAGLQGLEVAAVDDRYLEVWGRLG
ncbi:MAG: class I SAM-dependent methyltransferase [Cyanobium sp.]